MTYQSSPMHPIIFPDQAACLNPYGYQLPKGNKLMYEHLLPAGHSAHPKWKREADTLAMARVHNTTLMKDRMLRPLPSIKGSHYTTKVGEARQLMRGRLHGGTVSTAEGERMVGDLLRDRRNQLDAVDASSFSVISPERLSTVTPEKETYKLDSLFANILTSLAEGFVNPSIVSTLQSIAEYFALQSDTIPERKFAEYKDSIGDMATLAQELETRPELRQNMLPSERRKKSAILNTFLKILRELTAFIEYFETYISSPTKTKTAALAGRRNRLLASLSGISAPAYARQQAEAAQEYADL